MHSGVCIPSTKNTLNPKPPKAGRTKESSGGSPEGHIILSNLCCEWFADNTGLKNLTIPLGHFQVGSYRFGSLIRRSIYLIEALKKPLYTPNSPPVVSFNSGPSSSTGSKNGLGEGCRGFVVCKTHNTKRGKLYSVTNTWKYVCKRLKRIKSSCLSDEFGA